MERRTVSSFIFAVIKPFRYYLYGLIAIAVTWAFLMNVQPYIVKLIVNTAQTPTNRLFHTMSMLVMLYLFFEIIHVVIFRVYDWIVLRMRPAMKRHIGLVLMDIMLDQSYSFYQQQFAGNLTTRINDIIVGIPDLIKITIDRLLACFLMLIFVLYTLSSVNIKFTIALAIWMFFFLAIAILVVLRNQHLARDVAQARADVTGCLVDILTNITSVRLFARKKYEYGYIHDSMDITVEKEQLRDWFFLKLYAFQGGSFLVVQAICFWWLLQGLIHKTLTAGDFTLVLTLNIYIIENFWNIAKEMRDFWEKMGNVVQGLAIIQAPAEITDKPNAPALVVTRGEIIFDKVQFHYKDAELLFEDKSIIIPPYQKVGLVGHSGSGKTTFVNLILRLFDVSSGRILIDGQDISDVTQKSLHQSIAMIPQDISLFHRSIYDNIRYGKIDATEQEIIDAAKRAHAHEFIIEMSAGYDTHVGERGIKLSGGQRQRIVIARAILKNAPILILDEATSQLDSITEAEIQESLWGLMQERTTLVIAHRLSTLLQMDRILVFEHGDIVEDGTHDQLITQNGLYKTLWDAQVGGFLTDGNEEY